MNKNNVLYISIICVFSFDCTFLNERNVDFVQLWDEESENVKIQIVYLK